MTQSIADIEALTGQPGLLASMADNFAGFIIHRQSAPESRDWLAKLMGTTALWQSTDQTSGHTATGAGSRRRVREFRVSSDTFSELRVGEAVIHATFGPPPAICQVRAAQLPPGAVLRRTASAKRSPSEIRVHPAAQLPATSGKERATAPAPFDDPSSDAPRACDRRYHDHHAGSDAHPDDVVPQQSRRAPQTFDDA